MNHHDAMWIPLDNAIEAFESAIASASHDLAGAIEHENARNARRDLRACIEEAIASAFVSTERPEPTSDRCEACDGSGDTFENLGLPTSCSACNGTGKARTAADYKTQIKALETDRECNLAGARILGERVEKLAAALAKYGRHLRRGEGPAEVRKLPTCAKFFRGDKPCDCGLDAEIEAARAALEGKP